MKKITNSFVMFFLPSVNSPKWLIGLKDAVQALIRAVGADVCTFLIQSLQEDKLVFDPKALAIVALSAVFTYMSYAWFSGKPS